MKQPDLCPYATLFAAVLLALAPVRAKGDNHPGSKPADSTEAVAATQPTTRPFTLTTDDAGPFVRAQLAGDLAVSDETRARVAELVRLGGAAEWRTREKAGNALGAMGVDGAIAMLGLRDLSPAERQTVDVCLARWPVIERTK